MLHRDRVIPNRQTGDEQRDMELSTIASGSSGNCTYAGTQHTAVLVDAGISGRRIEQGLYSLDRSPKDISAILVTHEHSDHIAGLGVLARRYHIPIYTTPGTAQYIYGCRSVGKIDPALINYIHADEAFRIGDLTIEPFRISHDAAQPVGFRLSDGKKKIAVATDMGCYDDYIVGKLQGLDALLLEANHDVNMLQVGPYPYPLKQRILGQEGHLSNELAGRLLCDILHDDIQQILLGHLSKENNYAALALATVISEVKMERSDVDADALPIEVAGRDTPSEMYCI